MCKILQYRDAIDFIGQSMSSSVFAFSCLVWCGVVWCGVVWCGVVWCGVVWCGVVWCGVVWCGVVWYMVWYMAWYMVYGMVYGMVWYNVWYGIVFFCTQEHKIQTLYIYQESLNKPFSTVDGRGGAYRMFFKSFRFLLEFVVDGLVRNFRLRMLLFLINI